jgi:hypothetical protein
MLVALLTSGRIIFLQIAGMSRAPGEEMAKLKALHASCISSPVMPRKYAGFTRTCRSHEKGVYASNLRQSDAAELHDHGLCNFLAVAPFVLLGKTSFHALEGLKKLFPFVFPAHAKFC